MCDTINTQLIVQFLTPSLVIMLLKGISLFSDPESKGLQFDCIMKLSAAKSIEIKCNDKEAKSLFLCLSRR